MIVAIAMAVPLKPWNNMADVTIVELVKNT